MTDPFAEVNAIVKRRHETGEYGDAHFRLPRALLDQMRAQVPPAEPDWPLRNPLANLLSIPIVVDEDLPPGTWRLVRNGTGDELQAGVIHLPAETKDADRG